MVKTKFMTELIEIQNEYIQLLELGLVDWKEEYFIEFVEELNLFWKKNENALNSIYEYEFPELDTVFLTAVTKIDLHYLQHYSMRISGAICIIDDPLMSYLNLLQKNIPSKLREKFSEVIQQNIHESIELFKICSHDFFILPIRSVVPMEINNEAANQFFVSLFDGIISIEDYFEKIDTFEDIERYLKEPVKDWILFGWEDEVSTNNSLKERFTNFIDKEFIGNKNTPVNQIFFLSQIGYLTQGINILFTMSTTKFIPYIRGDLPFRYLTILYSSLKYNLHFELDQQIIRTSISYFFERIFDFEKFRDLSYEEFLNRISGLNLYQYVIKNLYLENKNLEEISLSEINLSVNEFYKIEFLSRF